MVLGVKSNNLFYNVGCNNFNYSNNNLGGKFKMTNEIETLRSLTWKRFWRQKKEEIGKFLLWAFIIISIIGILVQIGWMDKDTCFNNRGERCPAVPYEPMLPSWMMYIGWVTTAFWLVFGITYWIRTNWKAAKDGAKWEYDRMEQIRIAEQNKNNRRKGKHIIKW